MTDIRSPTREEIRNCVRCAAHAYVMREEPLRGPATEEETRPGLHTMVVTYGEGTERAEAFSLAATLSTLEGEGAVRWVTDAGWVSCYTDADDIKDVLEGVGPTRIRAVKPGDFGSTLLEAEDSSVTVNEAGPKVFTEDILKAVRMGSPHLSDATLARLIGWTHGIFSTELTAILHEEADRREEDE